MKHDLIKTLRQEKEKGGSTRLPPSGSCLRLMPAIVLRRPNVTYTSCYPNQIKKDRALRYGREQLGQESSW